MRRNQLIYLVVFAVSFVFSANFLHAQLSQGGIPEALKLKLKTPDVIDIVMPDSLKVKAKALRLGGNHKKILHFADIIDVNINPNKQGEWQIIGNLNVWSIKIRSKNAVSIGLTFENYALKSGEKLFIYNQSAVLGAFTDDYNVPSGIFTTQHIDGEEIIVEFSSPYSQPGAFTIKKVAHAFRSFLPDPGSCNININCPQGQSWQKEKRAVAKINVNGEVCSGALINNTNNDGKAYFLTANHCVNNNEQAAATVFYFNYESPSCENAAGDKTHVLTGAKVKSTLYEYDFTLLELNQHPPMPFVPYYAGWSLKEGDNLIGVTGIHHPQGNVKKISIENNQVTSSTYVDESDPSPRATNGFWLINKWDAGVTEGGSSGSPLFDNEHRIIGSLTGGIAECIKPDSDYYACFSKYFITTPRFDTDTLSKFLDPNQSGVTAVNGFDPFPYAYKGCDTLSHLLHSESSVSIPYDKGTGYYSGHNSDSISSFAEKFYTSSTSYLYGAIFSVDKCGGNGGIIVSVLSDNNRPDSILFQKYVALSSLQSNTNQFIEFYPNVKVKGFYYIAYTINYENSDTFSVKQSPLRYAETLNTFWLKPNNIWIAFNNYSNNNASSALDIKVNLCIQNDTQITHSTDSEKLIIYPNPTSNTATIKLPKGIVYTSCQLYGYDIMGKSIPLQFEKIDETYLLNLTNLSSGLYFVKIIVNNNIFTEKIIKN